MIDRYDGFLAACKEYNTELEYDEQALRMPIPQLQHCILRTFWNQQ